MFHIHTFEGIQQNVPLESLAQRKHIKKIAKNSQTRKTLIKNNQTDDTKQKILYEHAEKAYSDAIKLKHNREELLYAYMIMSKPVIMIQPEMLVTDAWDFFTHSNVSHMPVLDHKKNIIGIVTDRDLLRHLIINNKIIENTSSKIVQEIMTTDVITASSVTDIRRIAKVLFDHHIGTMPIIDNQQRLTGIITRSDILYALIHYPTLKMWG